MSERKILGTCFFPESQDRDGYHWAYTFVEVPRPGDWILGHGWTDPKEGKTRYTAAAQVVRVFHALENRTSHIYIQLGNVTCDLPEFMK